MPLSKGLLRLLAFVLDITSLWRILRQCCLLTIPGEGPVPPCPQSVTVSIRLAGSEVKFTWTAAAALSIMVGKVIARSHPSPWLPLPTALRTV